MRRNGRIFVAPLALIALIVGSLLIPAVAFAAVAQFRYEHGEPLNNLKVTPGATFSVTAATICKSGYASSVRDVSESEKNHVYAEYGVSHHTTGQYEIDHLISLELGGSNAIGNLWPELNNHPKGYLNSKDILENRLHDLVCRGKVNLRSAQQAIATDWVSTYHQYLGSWPAAIVSLPTVPSTTAPSATTSTTPSATTSTTPSATTSTAPSATTSTQGTGVRITSLSNPVAPGDYASLTAHSGKPNDICTLSVTLPSGATSASSGLGTTTANANGDATWTWKIGTTTGAGTAQAMVSCSNGSAVNSFTIT